MNNVPAKAKEELGFKRMAVRVIAKAKAYDARVSVGDENSADAKVEAWAEHFALTRCDDLSDLLAAVAQFDLQPRDRVVQPADITSIVKANRRDWLDRQSVPQSVPANEDRRLALMGEIRKHFSM